MIQKELGSFINLNEKNREEIILDLFKEGQPHKINRRINLRMKGFSIYEIAQKEKVSPQAIYYSLKIHAPQLLTKNFLIQANKDKELLRFRTKKIAPNVSLNDLIQFRKQKFSIYAVSTHPNRPARKKLFYVYIHKRIKGKLLNRYIGRITRDLLFKFEAENIISQKEKEGNPRLSLNDHLDIIIEKESEVSYYDHNSKSNGETNINSQK